MTQMLDEGRTPEVILEDILGEWDLQILDSIPTRFSCNCDRKRVEKVVISLGRDELKKMIDDGEPVEFKCHFCNKAYEFSQEDLKRIYKEL